MRGTATEHIKFITPKKNEKCVPFLNYYEFIYWDWSIKQVSFRVRTFEMFGIGPRSRINHNLIRSLV